jgi:hypothetical protein
MSHPSRSLATTVGHSRAPSARSGTFGLPEAQAKAAELDRKLAFREEDIARLTEQVGSLVSAALAAALVVFMVVVVSGACVRNRTYSHAQLARTTFTLDR